VRNALSTEGKRRMPARAPFFTRRREEIDKTAVLVSGAVDLCLTLFIIAFYALFYNQSGVDIRYPVRDSLYKIRGITGRI